MENKDIDRNPITKSSMQKESPKPSDSLVTSLNNDLRRLNFSANIDKYRELETSKRHFPNLKMGEEFEKVVPQKRESKFWTFTSSFDSGQKDDSGSSLLQLNVAVDRLGEVDSINAVGGIFAESFSPEVLRNYLLVCYGRDINIREIPRKKSDRVIIQIFPFNEVPIYKYEETEDEWGERPRKIVGTRLVINEDVHMRKEDPYLMYGDYYVYGLVPSETVNETGYFGLPANHKLKAGDPMLTADIGTLHDRIVENDRVAARQLGARDMFTSRLNVHEQVEEIFSSLANSVVSSKTPR